MGLDVSHDCWSGAYSSFNTWRRMLSRLAGYGDLTQYHGYGGDKPWPANDVLVSLLHHSDCDGELEAAVCGPLADRLEELFLLVEIENDWPWVDHTAQFIKGLRSAASKNQTVRFR